MSTTAAMAIPYEIVENGAICKCTALKEIMGPGKMLVISRIDKDVTPGVVEDQALYSYDRKIAPTPNRLIFSDEALNPFDIASDVDVSLDIGLIHKDYLYLQVGADVYKIAYADLYKLLLEESQHVRFVSFGI